MKKIILTIGVPFFFLALSTQIHAADTKNSQDDLLRTPPIASEKDANKGAQGLEQRMSPEQRQRFNQDMETQTGEAYPDRAEIESRRQKMREQMQERMQQADTDHDNSISRAEAEESMPGVARHFDQIDANHDGVITYDELKTAQEKKHQAVEQQVKQDKDKKAQPKHGKKRARKNSSHTPKQSKQQLPSVAPPPDDAQQPH